MIGGAFAPPPPPDRATVDAAVFPSPLEFGQLRLIGAQLDEEITLIWHANDRPRADWRTELRVRAPDGSVVWSWRRSPGYGRWSTDHWTAGTILADVYRVAWPDWAGPGDYRVEVGLQQAGGAWALPPGATVDQPWLTIGEVTR